MWRTVVLLVAIVSAAGAVAGLGGGLDARLDVLAHFAPIWLAGGLLALLLSTIVKPRRRSLATLALIAVVAGATLMAPELLAPRPRAPAGDGAIKVVQFNVWGRNDTWPATARWLFEQDADVIVLEETRPTQPLPVGFSDRYPYRTACGDPGRCETVILSRYRPLASGGLEDGSKPFLSAVWATLDAPGGPVTVVGAHYTRPNDVVRIQAQGRRLAALVRDQPRDRLIVAGDFNLTPWSALLRRQDETFGLERVTRALPSWPGGPVSGLRIWTPFAVMPIDHVYIGPGWRAVSVERGPKVGSDHYPVVVTLTPAPPSPPSADR